MLGFCLLSFFDIISGIFKPKKSKMKIYTKKKDLVIELGKATHDFNVVFWANGGYAQTVLSCIYNPYCAMRFDKRELILNSSVALDWCFKKNSKSENITFIICHGMGGSSNDSSVRDIVKYVNDIGYTSVVYNRRGHFGGASFHDFHRLVDIEELHSVVKHVRSRSNGIVIGIGLSAGGNQLLKYVGVMGEYCSLNGSITISHPFDLLKFSQYLRANRHVDKILHFRFMRVIKHNIKKYQLEKIQHVNALTDFYQGVLDKAELENYLEESSCMFDLADIKVPTLHITCLDDPLLDDYQIRIAKSLPYINHNITTITSSKGGHLGWIAPTSPIRNIVGAYTNHIRRQLKPFKRF